MQTGMMWFDNDPKTTLTVKIVRAADYYRQKYGRVPDVCLVNPIYQTEAETHVGRITVQPFRPVLPGHLWIGCEEAPLRLPPNGEHIQGESKTIGEIS